MSDIYKLVVILVISCGCGKTVVREILVEGASQNQNEVQSSENSNSDDRSSNDDAIDKKNSAEESLDHSVESAVDWVDQTVTAHNNEFLTYRSILHDEDDTIIATKTFRKYAGESDFELVEFSVGPYRVTLSGAIVTGLTFSDNDLSTPNYIFSSNPNSRTIIFYRPLKSGNVNENVEIMNTGVRRVTQIDYNSDGSYILIRTDDGEVTMHASRDSAGVTTLLNLENATFEPLETSYLVTDLSEAVSQFNILNKSNLRISLIEIL